MAEYSPVTNVNTIFNPADFDQKDSSNNHVSPYWLSSSSGGNIGPTGPTGPAGEPGKFNSTSIALTLTGQILGSDYYNKMVICSMPVVNPYVEISPNTPLDTEIHLFNFSDTNNLTIVAASGIPLISTNSYVRILPRTCGCVKRISVNNAPVDILIGALV